MQRKVGGHVQIAGGGQIGVDRRRHCAAPGVAHDDHQPDRAQLIDGVSQAGQAGVAQHVAHDPDDKQIIGLLAEDEFDGHAGVGATEKGGEWLLRWGAARLWADAEVER